MPGECPNLTMHDVEVEVASIRGLSENLKDVLRMSWHKIEGCLDKEDSVKAMSNGHHC